MVFPSLLLQRASSFQKCLDCPAHIKSLDWMTRIRAMFGWLWWEHQGSPLVRKDTCRFPSPLDETGVDKVAIFSINSQAMMSSFVTHQNMKTARKKHLWTKVRQCFFLLRLHSHLAKTNFNIRYIKICAFLCTMYIKFFLARFSCPRLLYSKCSQCVLKKGI